MEQDEGNTYLNLSCYLGRRKLLAYLGMLGLGGIALLGLETQTAHAKSTNPGDRGTAPGLETVEDADGYTIDVGISTLDGSVRNTALTWEGTANTPPVTHTSSGLTSSDINLVTTQKDFYKALGISAEATASYGLASVSAKMKFAEEFTTSSFSSWLVIRVSISSSKAMLIPNDVQLKPEALAVLGDDNGPARFFQTYGDRFVYGLEYGAEFLAVMQIDATSDASKQKLEANWNANAQGSLLSGSTSGSIDKTVSQLVATNTVQFHCKTIGPGDLPSSLDTDTVIKFALAFPATVQSENSVPINAFLQDYRIFTLPPDITLNWPDLEYTKRVMATMNGYLQTLQSQLAIAQDIASNANRYGWVQAPQVQEKYTAIATEIRTDITNLNEREETAASSFTSEDTPTVPSLPAVPRSVQNPVMPPGDIVAYYQIKNSRSGQVIGVDSASTGAGAQLVQWPANGSPDQNWMLEAVVSEAPVSARYCSIINSRSGQVIGVDSASMNAGAQLVQWPANGSLDQQWTIEGEADKINYLIRNRNSGQVIGVNNGSTNAGAQLVQWPANGSTDQNWTLVAIFAL